MHFTFYRIVFCRRLTLVIIPGIRALCYLCRDLDQLKRDEDYSQIQPVIQISFLNFILFPEHPEFYATYKLLNVNNHTLYSDKLQISVVDLTQIQLATKENKAHQIDYRASLFACKDWEELTILAEKDSALKEQLAVKTKL